MDEKEAFETMRNLGLFACPLNNGDWLVGRASYIYSFFITDDHYQDEHVEIAPTLIEAIEKWIENHT